MGIWTGRRVDAAWKQQIQGKIQSKEKTSAGDIYMRSNNEGAISLQDRRSLLNYTMYILYNQYL